MAKIAMIGAGSLVFGKTLMADFLATEALAGSEYALHALTHKRLDRMHAFVQRMIRDNGVDATVSAGAGVLQLSDEDAADRLRQMIAAVKGLPPPVIDAIPIRDVLATGQAQQVASAMLAETQADAPQG